MFNDSKISQRLRKLEKHLQQENPILSDVVQNFRELDGISRRIGYFHREESHATRTPWWPLISILGIYSAGKSSFINHFLQYNLQSVGIQAVDDKFSVICYTRDKKERVLPGLALDADPRLGLRITAEDVDAGLRLPGATVLLGVDKPRTPELEAEVLEVLPVGGGCVVLSTSHRSTASTPRRWLPSPASLDDLSQHCQAPEGHKTIH